VPERAGEGIRREFYQQNDCKDICGIKDIILLRDQFPSDVYAEDKISTAVSLVANGSSRLLLVNVPKVAAVYDLVARIASCAVSYTRYSLDKSVLVHFVTCVLVADAKIRSRRRFRNESSRTHLKVLIKSFSDFEGYGAAGRVLCALM